MSESALVVLSGGMDSATALAWVLNHGVTVRSAVHFQYGSKHNKREAQSATLVSEYYNVPLNVIQLDFINQYFSSDLLLSGGEIPDGHYSDESMKRTVVPFRNGIMLSIAAGLAESQKANRVVIGNHFGDHAIYPDCREQFIDPMRRAIFNGTDTHVELVSPFCFIDKTAIAMIGTLLEVPFAYTWSCYKGGEKHCGKCGSCTERREAFQQSNVSDPTRYEL